jgi:glutaconate CoA-transferase, subunit B
MDVESPAVETLEFSDIEMMTVAAARLLRDGAVCFVGIGMPSVAANLARATHAPNLVLVYESGTIGAKPRRLPLSIGDGELAETADAVVSLPEIFNYWLQGGRIDVGFLGAAQIDRFGNLNSTTIGDYWEPTVRLPGAGGAPEIAASCCETIILMQQSKRSFVRNLDFRTSVGFGDGDANYRTGLGLLGKGPSQVVTDLGVWCPDHVTHELVLAAIHPGISVDDVCQLTGWEVVIADDLHVTPPPTPAEITALRDLQAISDNRRLS